MIEEFKSWKYTDAEGDGNGEIHLHMDCNKLNDVSLLLQLKIWNENPCQLCIEDAKALHEMLGMAINAYEERIIEEK